jgi:uncharacterized protein
MPTIDTDLHPMPPGLEALRPHLEPFWADAIAQRGLEGFETQSYPPRAPRTVAPAHRPADGGFPTLAALQSFLHAQGTTQAVLHCLYGVQLIFNADMNAGFTRALNDWVRAEWLARDARLRASIVLPNEPDHAVAEIERLAPDHRFVAGLRLVMGNELQHGRRAHWPVYEALVRHDLPLVLHAGSAYRQPVTSLGWPSWVMEDAAANQQGFQSALASLVTEGVFVKFPSLRVVLAESGCTWLPAFLWRLTKSWKGVRFEIPWQAEPPTDTVRRHVWLTTTPFDAPDDAAAAALSQLAMPDRLLPASDWPHWNEPTALPLDAATLEANARAAFPRLNAG